nr:hypothetical protein Iba_chr11bCG0040 [Ipomoea batatas]
MIGEEEVEEILGWVGSTTCMKLGKGVGGSKIGEGVREEEQQDKDQEEGIEGSGTEQLAKKAEMEMDMAKDLTQLNLSPKKPPDKPPSKPPDKPTGKQKQQKQQEKPKRVTRSQSKGKAMAEPPVAPPSRKGPAITKLPEKHQSDHTAEDRLRKEPKSVGAKNGSVLERSKKKINRKIAVENENNTKENCEIENSKSEPITEEGKTSDEKIESQKSSDEPVNNNLDQQKGDPTVSVEQETK